jgi:pilus assembly protein CpaC
MKNWGISVMLALLVGVSVHAQTNIAPEGSELVADPTANIDPTRQKYLALYIGIEAQEKLPYIPEGATFKGDFKKVTEVSVARQLSTLLFTPVREGVATLIIYDAAGKKIFEFRIDVKKSNLTKVAREMRGLLADIEGITIKIINNRVVVDGMVLLPADMSRIHSVVKQYDGQASNIVRISPQAQRKIAEMIQNDIRNPEITVRAINEKFILEGVANDKDEKDRAEIIAKTYVPDIIVDEATADGKISKIKRDMVINLLTIKQAPPPEPGKIIQLVIHFVELNKNYQKGFSFSWMPGIKEDRSSVDFGTGAGAGGGGLVSTVAGTINNLLPKLNWAKTHGHARILQSSSLLAMDGQKGDLRSTVRLPYQVVNGQGQPSTNFEEAGLISSITPQIINSRSDSIKLTMEFSMKNLLGITDKGPMISNSSLQTQIVVRSGQSAAVGGLISNTTGTDYNKLPKGAPEQPLLSLYASKSFQRNQSQFVVFVTPIIKSSASAGAEKIKKKFRLRE